MQTSGNHGNIDSVLAEADALIRKIDSMVIDDIEEKHQIEFEKCCQNLKNTHSKIQEKISETDDTREAGSYAEGFHEAFQEIVKAMDDLKKILN